MSRASEWADKEFRRNTGWAWISSGISVALSLGALIAGGSTHSPWISVPGAICIGAGAAAVVMFVVACAAEFRADRREEQARPSLTIGGRQIAWTARDGKLSASAELRHALAVGRWIVDTYGESGEEVGARDWRPDR